MDVQRMLPISVHIPHYARSTIIKTQNWLGELTQNTEQIRNISHPFLWLENLRLCISGILAQLKGNFQTNSLSLFAGSFPFQNLYIFVWNIKSIYKASYLVQNYIIRLWAQFNLSRFKNISRCQQYIIICLEKKIHLPQNINN